jgi:hypothetical protein
MFVCSFVVCSFVFLFVIACQVTSGDLRNDLKEEWEVEEVAKLLATNNAAERPFAVAKAYLDIYGRMKLCNLAQFSLAMCNDSHRVAGPNGKQKRTEYQRGAEAGVAITADPRLKHVVTQLCTVRRAKYGRDKSGVKPGTITELLAQKYESDRVAENERRLGKEAEEKAKMAKKHLNKAVKFNMAAEEALARTSMELEQHLKAMDYKKGVCLAALGVRTQKNLLKRRKTTGIILIGPSSGHDNNRLQMYLSSGNSPLGTSTQNTCVRGRHYKSNFN